MTTVLVTGASGFIAKHIIRELLDRGLAVRGSVRSDRRRAELDALFGEGRLEYAQLDLDSDEGWADAMSGVDALMHTASPFPGADPEDPQELIGPAVEGTLRALRAARAAGVTRVVLTSSCAAIYKDAGKPRDAASTEANWTDPDGSETTAYEASKTLAERAAWDFVAEHPEMQLTSINPGLVMGPALDSRYGTSLELVEQILGRAFPMYPAMVTPAVDVRDVARMHVAALTTPASVGKRLAGNAGAVSLVELATTLSEAYPERKIPTRRAPDFVVRLGGRFNPQMKTAAANLGRNMQVVSTAEETLGFRFIPTREAALASAEFLVAQEGASASDDVVGG
jgi:dihydroflavonol-4-reductase